MRGDQIERPKGGGKGQGSGDAGESGGGEDDFVFHLTKEEFMQIFFDDLALPRMLRTQLVEMPELKPHRAGFSNAGTPSNLSVLRSMRSAIGRRVAIGAGSRSELVELEGQLALLTVDLSDPIRTAERQELESRLVELRARLKRIPYLDPIDLRYRNRVRVPVPTAKAVMFCLMDVSGSMDEARKELAKRFFILLYLFLTRHYEKIDLVFIRHHTQAQEVDEESFFRARETGGTVVSSALVLMDEIIGTRYSTSDWNIYAAQASDGDNWHHDSGRCRELLTDSILPKCRYFAYVQVAEEEQNLWEEYARLQETQRGFAMRKVTEASQIYPVFRDLFKTEGRRHDDQSGNQLDDSTMLVMPADGSGAMSATPMQEPGTDGMAAAATIVANTNALSTPTPISTPSAFVPSVDRGRPTARKLRPERTLLQEPLPAGPRAEAPLPDPSDWTFELVEEYHDKIRAAAQRFGLDTYPNQLEVITAEQMMDAYASVGMPVNYRHWSYGKEFIANERSYRRGQMGLAYEIVINSDPCISYLMEENTTAMQALVIAHAAYGHNSFFKGNYLFRLWTDASSIIDYLVYARNFIAECEERHGMEQVEDLLDSCHALQNYGVDRYHRPSRISLAEELARRTERQAYAQTQVNDIWRTLPKRADRSEESTDAKRFPLEPQENILYFIEKNAPPASKAGSARWCASFARSRSTSIRSGRHR